MTHRLSSSRTRRRGVFLLALTLGVAIATLVPPAFTVTREFEYPFGRVEQYSFIRFTETRHGPFECHQDGSLVSRGEYRWGKLHGVLLEWNAQGREILQTRYRRGASVRSTHQPPWIVPGRVAKRADGWFEWRSTADGSLQIYGELRGGLRQGLWTHFDSSGEISGQESYRDGQVVGIAWWDPPWIEATPPPPWRIPDEWLQTTQLWCPPQLDPEPPAPRERQLGDRWSHFRPTPDGQTGGR